MLRPGDKANFQTLLDAARNNRLVAAESRDIRTGEYVAVLCAVNRVDDEFQMVPLGELCRRDPFEIYHDPSVKTLPPAVEPQLVSERPDHEAGCECAACMTAYKDAMYAKSIDIKASEAAENQRWAAAIAFRFVDNWKEAWNYVEEAVMVEDVLTKVLAQHPEEMKKLIGTAVIEDDYFEDDDD